MTYSVGSSRRESKRSESAQPVGRSRAMKPSSACNEASFIGVSVNGGAVPDLDAEDQVTAAGAGAVPSSDRYNGAVSAALVGGVARSPPRLGVLANHARFVASSLPLRYGVLIFDSALQFRHKATNGGMRNLVPTVAIARCSVGPAGVPRRHPRA